MDDGHYMLQALRLSEMGLFSVSPNPMVGCVIVRDGTVLGQGWHHRAGEPHAEIESLRDCKTDPRGATMYVSLEPCAHHGRTPPCVDAVIAAGVARVVVAIGDPSEQVNGRGIERLRAAGVEVEVGVRAAEAARINEKFIHATRTKSPFVLLKAGMSLDGKLATVTGESQWITSPKSREQSSRLRWEYDAILVGAGTVKADDPQLTRRMDVRPSITPWLRVVVDTDGDIPMTARVLSDGEPALLFTSKPGHYTASPGLEVAELPEEEGRLDLDLVLRELYTRGIRSVIVEGGSILLSDFIRRRMWQKMLLYVAPVFLGGGTAPSIFSGDGISRLTDAYRFRFYRTSRTGSDLAIIAYPEDAGEAYADWEGMDGS